jgi:hypothetical protein
MLAFGNHPRMVTAPRPVPNQTERDLFHHLESTTVPEIRTPVYGQPGVDYCLEIETPVKPA